MAFIRTVPQDEASGDAASMYESAVTAFGHLPNFTRAFSLRPGVMNGWTALLSSIRGNMDARRYELVTLAAARELRSSYCMLAHGSVLLRDHMTPDDLRFAVTDSDPSPLGDDERAIMRFAAKVVRDASSVEEADVTELKAYGLGDPEIFDIVTAAAARCFFSKTLDALGIEPDAHYRALEPELQQMLTVGRAIENEG